MAYLTDLVEVTQMSRKLLSGLLDARRKGRPIEPKNRIGKIVINGDAPQQSLGPLQ